jgi:membrane-associated phospholipid phosphatase
VVRRPRTATLAALASAIGLATTGAIALSSHYWAAHDAATLRGFTALSHTRAGSIANTIGHLVDPRHYVLIGLVFVGIALLRRRPRLALVVPLTMLFSVMSAELLKPLVGAHRGTDWFATVPNLTTGSWPSGHATAAMTVALCGVLVAPRALRPLAAMLGTALTVGVSYSILVLHWHLPSDVLGGLLLAATWAALGVAALWWADARWPARAGRRALSRGLSIGVRHPLAPALLVAVALAGAIALFIDRAQIAGASEFAPASFTAAAIAIAAIAGGLATALAFALRR